MRATLQTAGFRLPHVFVRKFNQANWIMLFFALLSFSGIQGLHAQIYTNNFTGASACPTNGNVPTVASNATGTPLSRSTITCAATANVFNSNGLNLTASVSNTSYIEFSLTANSGYLLNVTSLSFLRQGSNTAPRQLEVRYSTDNFATSTTWGAAPNTPASGSVITWDMTDFSTTAAGTVTFRFYPYGTVSVNNGTPAATGTFRLDDVTVNGTVTSSAVPTVLTSGTLADVSTVYGTGSPTPASYTVSGSDLATDITITAPSGFEVSKTGAAGPYAVSQTLTPVSNTVAATTIHVRLATTTLAGTYSGNITNVSGSASSNMPTVSSTVAPKELTVSGATAQNKIYDRTVAAIITGATASGTVNGDVITISGGGTFDDFNFGTSKNVTAALTHSGTNATSYTLTQPTGLTANIDKKDVTVPDAEAQDKLFDGNTNATITGTLSGVIAPDSVTFIGTGTFASSAVGENINVNSTATIGGDASNYNLVQPTGLTANIYAEALLPQTITFNPLATATYGDANFNLTATASSELTVTYMSSNTDVATIAGNVVTIVGAGTTTITAMQDGNGTYEEAPPVDQALTVNPKVLTVNSALADNKIYDGNNTATFTGTLNGVINSDNVTLNATGTFASVTVAPAISVSSTATLGGTDAGNYTLTQPTGLIADISVKTLTADSATANNKIYDGNDAATLSNLTLTGVVGLDVVSAIGGGTFASSAVANGIVVTTALTLTGADAFNYTLTQPAGLSANITPLGLTISGLTGNDKVYDRTTAATLSGTPVLNGVVNAEDVSISGTPTATFNLAGALNNRPITVTGYTLSGADAGNYTVSQPTGLTGNITPAFVTISSAVAQNKPFDGTNAAVITGSLLGVISPDVVTLVGTGTFASSAVGNGIAVTSTATLTGAAAANYTINPQPTGLTANITPGPTILAPGDLAIIGFNVNTPDSFAFVAWVDIDNGTYIKFTDNGFLNSGSANATGAGRGGENFVIWRNNGATIPAGTVITINDTPSTNHGTIVSGNLNGLAGGGDNIFAYQGPATSGTNPDWTTNSNPTTFNGTVLFGLQMQGTGSAGSWLTTGTASANNSYLPSQLNVAGGNIALGGSASRGQYTGPRNIMLSLAGYKSYVTNSFYWSTNSGAGVVTLDTTPFILATPPTASVISGSATICAGDVANFSVDITGGTSPYVITYTDGTDQFMMDEYISGNVISVMPSVTSTYTLVSVVDNNSLVGTGNSGSATVIVNTLHDFYVDADGDTYGTGAPVSLCAADANTPPAGYAVLNGDCNDAVASIHPNATEIPYNGVDDDCDNAIDETGTVTTTLINTSCGTTLASIGSIVGITTIVGHPITGYRIRLTNGAQVQTLDTNVPHFTLTQFASYAYATTYTVEIQLQRAGIWQASWGTPCFVSTPAILEEGGAGSINPSQCGIELAKINTLIATTSLAGVTGYRFRVTNLTDPLGPNPVQTIDRTQNWFSLQMLTRHNYGTLYRIEVAVKTTGDFGGFGAPCEVSSPASPSLTTCGGIIPSKTTAIAATSLTGITQYRFQVTRQSDNAASTIDRSQNWFNFNMVPAINYTPGALYAVRVAVMTAGTWSPFGDACEITAPGGLAKGIASTDVATASVAFKVAAYPNPFNADFNIDVTSSASENVQVKVYDMLGRLIESKEMNVGEGIQKLGSQYPSGVYNLIVNQGDAVQTLRIIKR